MALRNQDTVGRLRSRSSFLGAPEAIFSKKNGVETKMGKRISEKPKHKKGTF